MIFSPRTLARILLSGAVALSLLCACEDNSYVRDEGIIWNTTYHITFKGPETLRDSVVATLAEVGRSLNVFDKNSLVSEVNASGKARIDRHFMNVYEASLRVNELSDGMFDPTLSPLITAWGFGPGHEANADTVAVDSILRFVGITKTRISGDSILKDDARTQFNFSAVAKGYGCDAVAEMLRRNGVNHYLVEIGGEIALGGRNPEGGNWRISVDKPVQTDSTEIHDAVSVVELTDAGIATSGNYRNFRKENGKTFGHTISPVSGRPVATDVISATVIAPTAMEADAMATACMAAGMEKSKEMLESAGMEGMLIRQDSSLWMTEGFREMTQATAGQAQRSRRGAWK